MVGVGLTVDEDFAVDDLAVDETGDELGVDALLTDGPAAWDEQATSAAAITAMASVAFIRLTGIGT